MDTETFEDVLSHFGVKGMKWGVRKETLSRSTRQAVGDAKTKVKNEVAARTGSEVTVRTKPGQGVRTVGGTKRMAHPDAIQARTSQQIAKKSTLDALSNKELQDLVTRMNLESQYSTLVKKEDRRSKGEKLAESVLNTNGDKAIGLIAKSHPGIGKLSAVIIRGARGQLNKRKPLVKDKQK